MHSKTKKNYHTRQLCRQVEQALDLALLCDCEDPILNALQVIAVRPISGPAILEAVLSVPTTDLTQLSGIHGSLQRSEGRFRIAINRAIHRKRTPRLRFVLVPRIETSYED